MKTNQKTKANYDVIKTDRNPNQPHCHTIGHFPTIKMTTKNFKTGEVFHNVIPISIVTIVMQIDDTKSIKNYEKERGHYAIQFAILHLLWANKMAAIIKNEFRKRTLCCETWLPYYLQPSWV